MNTPAERSKKNWKKFWPTILLITVVVFFYVEEDARGKWAWNRFKHEWEGKGEKFNATAFIPTAVPDDQNFALTPIAFTSYGQILTRDGKSIPYEKRDTNFVDRLSIRTDSIESEGPTNGIGNWATATLCDLKAWQNYYRALAATTNAFPVAAQPQTPAQDVLLALSKYDSTIEELRQAGRLQYSRFPLDYGNDNPAAILLPHLAPLKNCSLVLQLRAVAELQNGQSDKALEDVKLILRLADSIRNEPFLISHLVRIAMTTIALQPVYEGLEQHKWSDPQLAELDAELAKLDFLMDYKFAMRGEMAVFQVGNFDHVRRHPEEFLDYSSMHYDAPSQWDKAAGWLIPSGWFYQNQVRCARLMVEQYIPVADLNQKTISPSKVNGANAVLEAETEHLTPYNIAERILLPALAKSARRFARAQSSTDLGRTAIALERYRRAHGSYPETSDNLVPQSLEKVPHDIIDGQPLHYRRTDGGGFVLYSVGWNEADDGGQIVVRDTGTVDLEKGDWVWKYPAN